MADWELRRRRWLVTYEWVLREENLLREPAKWKDFYGNRPITLTRVRKAGAFAEFTFAVKR